MQMWGELLHHSDDVTKLYVTESDESVRKRLNKDWLLISNNWVDGANADGRRYTGIHSLGANDQILWNKGVNLNEDEWICMVRSVDEINNVMYGKQMSSSGKRRVWSAVGRPMWGWEISDLGLESPLYFSHADAMESGLIVLQVEKDKRGNPNLTVTVFEKQCDYPDSVDLMKLCKRELLIKYVKLAKASDCRACSLGEDDHDDAGDCHHDDAGDCQDPSMDFNKMFVPEGEFFVDSAVLDLYTRVASLIGMSSYGFDVLNRALLAYIPTECWVDLLNSFEKDTTTHPIDKLVVNLINGGGFVENFSKSMMTCGVTLVEALKKRKVEKEVDDELQKKKKRNTRTK